MTSNVQPERISVEVEPAKEIAEISRDFLRPVEVLREGIANAYDAGAKALSIVAQSTDDESGRRILNITLSDDGLGMDASCITGFFGLGFSQKPALPDRPPIGFKGHGTKIYYDAQHVWVATRPPAGPLLVAHVPDARRCVRQQQLPEPVMWSGAEAEQIARAQRLIVPESHGTTVRLIDFTADSGQLIDGFRRRKLENYIRWFTVYGAYRHIVRGAEPSAPLELLLQATDDASPRLVPYGHPWPEQDCTDLKSLKQRDERRPFNYFTKRFVATDRVASAGYRIDIAVAFEGHRARRDRDPCIRRQGNPDGVYLEEERYGLWLCKDHIPVDLRSDWLQDERLLTFAFLEPRRALVLVNCQDFSLTANRGSVGNSKADLLEAVKEETIGFLADLDDDNDLQRFRDEYEEERLARLREKDHKAFARRIERYNRKKLCSITLQSGKSFEFFEPDREIMVFGLLLQLDLLEKGFLELDLLDYDDHRGLDMLVRVGHDPTDLLKRDAVAYTELKFALHSSINHSFANLRSIVCWVSDVSDGGTVTDITGEVFVVNESRSNGHSHTVLAPKPGSKYSHQVRVIVLRRLLEERCRLRVENNPRPVHAK